MGLQPGKSRVAVAVVAGLASVLMLSAGSAGARVRHAPRHKEGLSTSTNWSGYAVDGTGATQVIGTWTQPSVTCAPGENSWSSPWVGIDGDTSNTVEQTGTDSDCRNGVPSYYAWYEMYPKSAVVLKMPVKASQTFTGSVRYSSGMFTLTLTNDTTGAVATEHLSSNKARRTSVEWIMEGPSNGKLSDFGQVPFSAGSAAISNTTGDVQSLGAQSITMVNSQGATRAQPFGLSGGSFGVQWVGS